MIFRGKQEWVEPVPGLIGAQQTYPGPRFFLLPVPSPQGAWGVPSYGHRYCGFSGYYISQKSLRPQSLPTPARTVVREQDLSPKTPSQGSRRTSETEREGPLTAHPLSRGLSHLRDDRTEVITPIVRVEVVFVMSPRIKTSSANRLS